MLTRFKQDLYNIFDQLTYGPLTMWFANIDKSFAFPCENKNQDVVATQERKIKWSKVQVFDTPQVSTVLRSNPMRLYFPVDLTGNLIMIEKLVSGGTWTGDLPIFSPTRKPLRHHVKYNVGFHLNRRSARNLLKFVERFE